MITDALPWSSFACIANSHQMLTLHTVHIQLHIRKVYIAIVIPGAAVPRTSLTFVQLSVVMSFCCSMTYMMFTYVTCIDINHTYIYTLHFVSKCITV